LEINNVIFLADPPLLKRLVNWTGSTYLERRKAPRFDASAIPNLKIINHAGKGEIRLIKMSVAN
jgi:hypothetical protein